MENNYSSIPETRAHVNLVRHYLLGAIQEIEFRSYEHDKSKMEQPELETFDRVTPKLQELTYGSQEYKQSLDEMQVALKHHYIVNRHHPEHFENGILGMNLIDILEMFCDWLAATKRHTDGDIIKSIEINAERFCYDAVLKALMKNTAEFFDKRGA
ncbi:MAG: DUF5662 family protein [Termitinemataceae bacterium]|nr:MAG: DUF5662 family protein [Termitinemataceae bacterium]